MNISLEDVVKSINGIYGESAEIQAARYAVDSANENGYGLGDTEIETGLDILSYFGAEFSHTEALQIAKSYRDVSSNL